MTLVVKAVAEGQGAVEAMNSQLLLNDGQGTPDEVLLAPLGLSVVAEGEVTTYQEPVDLDPPETFTPLIAYDDDLGGWVVVFATQDKISGIAGYQVKEGWGFWHTASSPWVLHDQGRHSVIKVRALDRVGNVREVELAATNPQNFYETPIFWGILLAVLAVAAVIFQVRRLWRLKRRKS
jgi:hypothetical protein